MLVPLFSVAAMTAINSDVEALKAKGTKSSQFGSATKGIVCGDRLCSEVGQQPPPPPPIPPKTPSNNQQEKQIPQPPKEVTPTITPSETAFSCPQRISMKDYVGQSSDNEINIARSNIPVTLPLHAGYFDGKYVYFIFTDTNDISVSQVISSMQCWKVEHSAVLSETPESALAKVYIFKNGLIGEGLLGHQSEVFTVTPTSQETYSALVKHIDVMWKNPNAAKTLISEKEIRQAEKQGLITITETTTISNMPQIVWPDGQIPVKEDKSVSDSTPYVGGQVIDINLEEKTVTFIAHRGWGPDGRTIYYIVVDATPSEPANAMGVTYAPTSANLIKNPAAVDLFQFMNGVVGTGPLGFQAGIASSATGDSNYTPMWRIYMIKWFNPENAVLLQTVEDINAYKNAGLIDVVLARPQAQDHIVNCPFIDPFQ